jgi:hypothetical protein
MTAAVTLLVLLIRALYMLRLGRKHTWFDVVLEGCIATIFGMIMWKSFELTPLYEWAKVSLIILAAWGAPRSLHTIEKRLLGGSRRSDYERKEK